MLNSNSFIPVIAYRSIGFKFLELLISEVHSLLSKSVAKAVGATSSVGLLNAGYC